MPIDPTTPRTRRVPAPLAALLVPALAVLLALLAAPAASAASSEPAPPDTGAIRAAHLAPDTGKADVVLTPFRGGEPVELDAVEFSNVTAYERVPAGLYTLDVRAAGEGPAAAPMISENVRVTPDSAVTVVATGERDDVSARVVYDDLRAPDENQARVRLISAVEEEQVTARVDGGPLLARDVTTGSATGYAEVAAQTWRVDVSTGAGTEQISRRVPVEAGGVYTLLVLEQADGGLELQAVQDSEGSGAMPVGGVDTGAGGLAGGTDGTGGSSDQAVGTTAAGGAALAVASALAALLTARAVRRGPRPAAASRGTPR